MPCGRQVSDTFRLLFSISPRMRMICSAPCRFFMCWFCWFYPAKLSSKSVFITGAGSLALYRRLGLFRHMDFTFLSHFGNGFVESLEECTDGRLAFCRLLNVLEHLFKLPDVALAHVRVKCCGIGALKR